MSTKIDNRTKEAKAMAEELGSSRERLLSAAARVFARRGYRGASMNEIVAEAGLSKGALYWNFAGKEELFFALLDERVGRRLETLLGVAGSVSGDEDVPDEVSRRFAAVIDEYRELALLFHEYAAMAARDPGLRASYVKWNAGLREGIASAVQARHRELGVPLAIPALQLATVAMALADGLSIEQLIDPDSVPPDLFGQVLSLIEDGMAARAKERG
jgi:AcrR family transcriptional regulator